MSIFKKLRKDVIIIYWEDCYTSIGEDWKTLEECKKWAEIDTEVIIKTIGWIIEKNSKYVLIASQKSLVSPQKYVNLIRIPISCVKKIVYLNKKIT